MMNLAVDVRSTEEGSKFVTGACVGHLEALLWMTFASFKTRKPSNVEQFVSRTL